MSIPGKQTINVGLPNESANSDPLYTAFNKVNQNFTTLFDNASPYGTFLAGNGVSVDANAVNGIVTITNTGVTNIIPGTNISVSQSNGNVTISAIGGNGGSGTVTRVGLEAISSSRLNVTGTSGSNIVSEGTFYVDLASSGVTPGAYNNPTVTIDQYGRITSASNNTVAGTVTSVGLTPGTGIQINGGPITSSGTMTVTNTGVTRLSAGSGISLSGSNGNVTVSAVTAGGTVTSVGVSSTQLVITGSPVVTSGTIGINLPSSATFSGNVTANRINANGGNINGNLVVTGNISPAAVNKVGGIKPGPGVDISLDGELTIDTANLPLSFGNFTANNNVLSIVNVDEDMILETDGNAEIQLVGNIGFYKPNVIPPILADRYFSASSDGQITILVPTADPTGGAVKIVGSSSGNVQSPVNTGTMLHVTGQNSTVARIYNDSIDNYSVWIGRRYNGNATSPTPVLAGQTITRFGATTYTSANTFTPLGVGRFTFIALEDQTATAQGSSCELSLTAIGANTSTTVATWTVADGMIGKVTGNLTGNTVSVSGNVTAGNLVIPTGNIIYTPRYGTFYSNVDQTNPVANTAMAMTFNNTGSANSVSVVSNSRLTIAKPGVYNIQFSAQLNKTGGGTSAADIWLAKNGTPIDWTNSSVFVTSGNPKIAAWNFVENVTVANTYYEIMWSSADTLVSLDSMAANTNPTRPGIPSVLVSVTPVGA